MIGAQLGPYALKAELGSGGMGTVYLAEDEGGGRTAIKIVHPHLLDSPGFFKRFLREAELGKSVDHPNVVRTLDVDALGNHHFLVMEYVEGKSLRALLGELGRAPEALLREIAAQVARGLTAIHAKGIIHRDIKPENILISDDHEVRIMDLGVAKLAEASFEITQEGQFAGSVLYAAPEQFGDGTEVGPAADLYSLGILLHELATGTNPFLREHSAAVIEAQLHAQPARLADLDSGVSSFYSEVVATLLAKDPAHRFASAETLQSVLEQAERSAWWTGLAPTLQARGRRLPRIRVPRETRLHGRDPDVKTLRAAWERARAGEGNSILLEGEAGIGKTRLLDAFVQGIEDDAHVLYGSYPPSGGLGGVSDAILEMFGELDPGKALAPYLSVTPSLLPGFVALLKHETQPTGTPPLDGDALSTVCTHLMRALAAEKPLCWIVEDLQFAPAESRALVLALARAAGANRVLLVASARPGLPEEEVAHFSRLEDCQHAVLKRLGAREVQELLEDAFRSETLAERLGGKLAKKSDGVPFFLFEMIRELQESHVLERQPDGSLALTGRITEIEVPSAVRDLIEGRLRGLSARQRMTIDAGAVMGVRFDPDLVADVLEQKKIRVLQHLAEIERRWGLVRGDAGETRFDQNQIQEVVYSDLTPDLRAEYHSMFAQAYARRMEGAPTARDAVFLANHELRGSHPERGLTHLPAALDHLSRSFRNEAAIELATLALDRPGLLERESRIQTLLLKADCHGLRGEREEEREALDEAVALSLEIGRLQHEARIALGTHLDRTGHYQQAQEVLELAERHTEDRAQKAEAACLQGVADLHLGNAERALDQFLRSRAMAHEAGDLGLKLMVAGSLGNAYLSLGRLDDAHETYAWLERNAQRSGDRKAEAKVSGSLGNIAWSLGRLDEAITRYTRWQKLAREVGDRLGEARATANIGLVHATQGRLDEARGHLHRSAEIAHEVGDLHAEANVCGNLGEILQSLGRLDEAWQRYERSLEIARGTGDRRSEASAMLALAQLRVILGDEDAGDAAREALDLLREVGDRRNEGYALLALGAVADGDHARALFEEALDAEQGIPFRLGVVAALVALGRLAMENDHAEAAAEHFDEAIERGESLGPCDEVHLAIVRRACLPDGALEAALAALDATTGCQTRMEARFCLWRATGNGEHLDEAHRLLAGLRDHAPERFGDSMIANVPLHREIMAAVEKRGAC